MPHTTPKTTFDRFIPKNRGRIKIPQRSEIQDDSQFEGLAVANPADLIGVHSSKPCDWSKLGGYASRRVRLTEGNVEYDKFV